MDYLEVKDLDSKIPLPPLFRGNNQQESDDEDHKTKQTHKRGPRSRFTLLSQRTVMNMMDDDKEVDFTEKEQEFGTFLTTRHAPRLQATVHPLRGLVRVHQKAGRRGTPEGHGDSHRQNT